MEQQQNELFAMIGELTYKLQLAQRENERLTDEVRTKTDLSTSVINDYNRLSVMIISANEENAQLKGQLLQTQEEVRVLERSIGICRPVRQTNSWRQDEIDDLEHSMRFCTPQRQTCEDSWMNNQADEPYGGGFMDIDNDLYDDNILEERICLEPQSSYQNHVITDEQMAGVYGEVFMETGI
jgi:hypothetical protein